MKKSKFFLCFLFVLIKEFYLNILSFFFNFIKYDLLIKQKNNIKINFFSKM